MLTTTDRRVQYTGDDQTKEFTFDFRVWEKSQIKVYQANEDEAWSDIDVTSNCEVTLNDDGTGTVEFSSAPKAGVTIAIVREMLFIQEDEYINGTRFNPREIEDRFDQDCAERQELLDGVNRAIKVPNTSTQTSEEIYEQLVGSTLFDEQRINRVNEIYQEIIELYGQFKGEIGEQNYLPNNEVSWDYNAENTANKAAAETDVVVDIPEGLQYRKGMNQLHVDVDGVVVAVDKDYEEVEPKDDNEYSTQLRFKVPLHDGQRIHVHTSFIGKVDYEEQLKEFEEQINEAQQRVENFNQELDKKIKESEQQLEEQTSQAEQQLDNKVEEAEKQLDDKVEEANENIDKAVEEFNSTVRSAYAMLNDVADLLGDANAINELREQSFLFTQQLSQYSALPYQVCQLNACACALSNTICAYTNPQDGVCTLSGNYNCNCCVNLPICYYPGTCTLHIAIDGVVLSCCNYREVANNNGSGQSCQIQTYVCLYNSQELHAWTGPYWCNTINYTAPEQITSCEYEGCCYECCTNSAICVSNNSCGCVLYSCFICNCGDNGGAICNQSNLFVCESEFYCNCACSNGGAIAVLDDGYTYLFNSCFEGNCACTDGGMFYASCGETFASSITACCNTANCNGGAIALTTVTCLNYNNGTLEGNCATTGSGGALCATCTRFAISGGSISNNYACECGGALALFNCSRAIVCNACIMNNTAVRGGGISVVR